jgi:branched-chain amino acid transport system substrate-binding protein
MAIAELKISSSPAKSATIGVARPLARFATGLFAAALLASPALAQEHIKLGAILSLEGVFSAVGTPERDGLQMAIDEINKAGGIGGKPVDLIVYDDGGDQAKAVQLANRLIFQDKVSAAFGPTVTPTGEMATPVFEQNHIVEIGFLAQDYLWKDTQYVFMSSPNDGVHGEAMVKYAAEKLGAKKIAFAYSNVPYGVNGEKVVAEMAKKYGVTIVAETKWGEDDIDFTPEASQLHAAKADAILAWGSCAISDAQMVKALRASGDTTPLVGNLCMNLPTIAKVAGKAADGAVSFSMLDYTHPTPTVAAFLDSYQKRFGHPASFFAAIAYDGVQLWANAVKRAGGKTDPDSISAALIGVDYDGLIGHFKITKDNHFGLDASAFKAIVLKDGVWSTL